MGWHRFGAAPAGCVPAVRQLVPAVATLPTAPPRPRMGARPVRARRRGLRSCVIRMCYGTNTKWVWSHTVNGGNPTMTTQPTCAAEGCDRKATERVELPGDDLNPSLRVYTCIHHVTAVPHTRPDTMPEGGA